MWLVAYCGPPVIHPRAINFPGNSPVTSYTPAAQPSWPEPGGSKSEDKTGSSSARSHQPLMSSMTGLDGRHVKAATPSPAWYDLSPQSALNISQVETYQCNGEVYPLFENTGGVSASRSDWPFSSRNPSKQDVDNLVGAIKSERRAKHEHDEGPTLACPLPGCKLNKPLRRPQALRVSASSRGLIKST
jgi:hypothetical protein